MRRAASTIFIAMMVFLVSSLASAAPNPCLAANDVGQDLENANKLRAARAQYTTCAQKTCNATIRTDCEAWLKRVDDKMPTVVVRVVDSRGQDVPNAEVTIDEAPISLDGGATSVDPGQRLFQARSKSGDVAEQKTLIVLKEKSRTITLRFNVALTQDGSRLKEASPPPSSEEKPEQPTTKKIKKEEPFPVAPAILAGVGVVALTAYVIFALNGASKIEDLEKNCAPRCKDEQLDPAKQDVLFSQVSFGIGVVALAGAAVLYFTGIGSSSSSSSTKVTGLRLHNGGLAF